MTRHGRSARRRPDSPSPPYDHRMGQFARDGYYPRVWDDDYYRDAYHDAYYHLPNYYAPMRDRNYPHHSPARPRSPPHPRREAPRRYPAPPHGNATSPSTDAFHARSTSTSTSSRTAAQPPNDASKPSSSLAPTSATTTSSEPTSIASASPAVQSHRVPRHVEDRDAMENTEDLVMEEGEAAVTVPNSSELVDVRKSESTSLNDHFPHGPALIPMNTIVAHMMPTTPNSGPPLTASAQVLFDYYGDQVPQFIQKAISCPTSVLELLIREAIKGYHYLSFMGARVHGATVAKIIIIIAGWLRATGAHLSPDKHGLARPGPENVIEGFHRFAYAVLVYPPTISLTASDDAATVPMTLRISGWSVDDVALVMGQLNPSEFLLRPLAAVCDLFIRTRSPQTRNTSLRDRDDAIIVPSSQPFITADFDEHDLTIFTTVTRASENWDPKIWDMSTPIEVPSGAIPLAAWFSEVSS